MNAALAVTKLDGTTVRTRRPSVILTSSVSPFTATSATAPRSSALSRSENGTCGASATMRVADHRTERTEDEEKDQAGRGNSAARPLTRKHRMLRSKRTADGGCGRALL